MIAALMVLSKGGISYDVAMSFAPSKARRMSFALAFANGHEIDWDAGRVKPPKSANPSGSQVNVTLDPADTPLRFGA